MPHYSILPAFTALVTDTVNVSMSPKDIEEQNRTEQDTGHQQYCILFQTCQLVRTFVCRSQSETLTHATLLLPHKASLLCQRLFPLTAHTHTHTNTKLRGIYCCWQQHFGLRTVVKMKCSGHWHSAHNAAAPTKCE